MGSLKFNFVGPCLALSLLCLVTSVVAEDLQKMLQYTQKVRQWDWEWVLIRINGVDGPLGESDIFSAADSQVNVTAVNGAEPPFQFNSPISSFVTKVEWDTNKPVWFEIGMVAFLKDTVSHLQVVLTDVDKVSKSDKLMEARLVLPAVLDEWVDVSPSNGDITLNLSIMRSRTPLFTAAQQQQMGLTEVIFDLKDGSKASLVHHLTPGNKKAVLYFPGRSDSFAHPNVLQLFKDKGYDFYSLDPRFCGRTRRFMDEKDIRFAHSIDNFDKYKEEIDLTLDFIRKNMNYNELLSYSHSTGALVTLNYAMLLGDEEPFDGYIFNGPFFDWGYVGGDFKEFLLENAAAPLEWLGIDVVQKQDALSVFQTRNWILYRWNTTLRPLIQPHVTTQFAKAATDVQNKIVGTPKSNPITSMPVLFIASKGDGIVMTSEGEERIDHVAANYTKVILDYNNHDVVLSATQTMNDDAIANITRWLDDRTPTHFSSHATRPSFSRKSQSIFQVFSSMMVGLMSIF